jgi:hypothetical protein
MAAHMDQAVMVELIPAFPVLMAPRALARAAQAVEHSPFGMPLQHAAKAATAVVEECLFTDNYHGISNHRF